MTAFLIGIIGAVIFYYLTYVNMRMLFGIVEFVVNVFLTIANLAGFVKQHRTKGATIARIDNLLSSDVPIVDVGLFKNGRKVGTQKIKAKGGTNLRIGNQVYI